MTSPTTKAPRLGAAVLQNLTVIFNYYVIMLGGLFVFSFFHALKLWIYVMGFLAVESIFER